LDRARAECHALVSGATSEQLRRRSSGTRWTNQQLLWNMVYGYLIDRTLLGLVRTFGRLPDSVSEGFARALSAGTRPFHLVNYLGSCGGALVFHGPRLTAKLDRVVASLHRRLDRETDWALASAMHFPEPWDPYFQDRMRLFDVYRYGTQHFDHHRRQLTLDD
jgi:hypothetical protein